MSRQPAFSVLELLLVLIVLSLTMGIGYSAVDIIKRQVFTSIRSSNSALTVQELNLFLKKDFNRANFLVIPGDSSILFSGDEEEVIYRIGSERIIRDNHSQELPFELTVSRLNWLSMPENRDRIYGLEMTVLANKKLIKLSFRRTLSSQDFLNQNDDY